MKFLEVLLLALGLAMDAFAISVAATATGKIDNKRAIFRLSFHFGLFQFLMPVIGWFAGEYIEKYIMSFGYWVAFLLLLIVGTRMIAATFKTARVPDVEVDPSRGFSLVLLSLATSIDALAVGFSLAMIKIEIWYPSVVIGIITAAMSLIGIRLGNLAGKKIGRSMAVAGGIILIVIGLKILLTHH
jgi:manganese efflux pump family protein